MVRDFNKHLAAFLLPLSSPALLSDIGLRLPQDSWSREEGSLTHLWSIEDDERVEEMGKFAFTLISHRLIRCSYFLQGFGLRSCTWNMEGSPRTYFELQLFRAYDLAYEAAKAHFESPGVKDCYEKSQFRLASVQQLVLGMREGGYEVSERMGAHLKGRHQRVICSEIIENSFHRQKRMKGA